MRGSRPWGLVVDDAGVSLAVDCTLVRRTTRGGYRCIGLDEADALLRSMFGEGGDPRPLHQRLIRMTEALNAGELPMAERLGLQHPLTDYTLGKFDEDEPRAGDGKWTSGGGGAGAAAGFVQAGRAGAAVAGTGLLGRAAGAVAGLVSGAFAFPAALLAGLVYPSGNWRVYQGTLPDRPDIDFRYDEGVLTLYKTDADGTRRQIFHDVPIDDYYRDESGRVVGTKLGDGFQVDIDRVLAPEPDASSSDGRAKPEPVPHDDEPRICPAPEEDVPHGSPAHADEYQQYVSGLSKGYAVRLNGVAFDGCREPRIMLEAKSTGYEALLTSKYSPLSDGVASSFINQARDQVVAAGGGPIEWHFREKGAADIARELLKNFPAITVIYDPMPKDLKSMESKP
ncbi:MAG TPA: Tox-REase-5 domain-containing protein [Stellaceae bacterium]|nr:Tox-REase-5 domain-containing protein [Stellaceae bacterium]